ncbi:MAG TPA: aminopeptidase P family protein [Candidatus Bathyarchaeota archaeon]|nr:aminopeptidase P family protein [Candidatus Bathyarchaeota archaeon]
MNQKESVTRRRNTIMEQAQERGYEAVVFFNEVIRQNPSNTIYVMPSALGDEHQTFIMDANGDTTLVMPHWGAPRVKASGEYNDVIVIKQEKGHHIKGTLQALSRYKGDKLGFDLSTVSAQMWYRIAKELGVSPSPEYDISDIVFKERSIKDEYEIEEICRAIEITETAFHILIEETKPGNNVHYMKKELDANMIELGAYEFSFDSSIGFIKGNNTDYLKHGDALSLDVGVRLETGYCSDMGRNWHVTWEKATEDYMDRAMQAQVDGINGIKPGMTGNQVLDHANELNRELGFKETVRTGHQIGLDVHDYTMPYSPSFGPIETDNQPLKPGMTLTYEPNRRDPKTNYRGHIEDIILVTKNGAECLNQMPYRITW